MASPTNVIHFQGLDITLPLSVGIAYEPGIGLVLDFGSGFSGKLTLKATEGAQGLASSAYTPLQPIAQQLASAAEPDTGAASHMDLDDPIPAGDSDGNASAIVETPAGDPAGTFASEMERQQPQRRPAGVAKDATLPAAEATPGAAPEAQPEAGGAIINKGSAKSAAGPKPKPKAKKGRRSAAKTKATAAEPVADPSADAQPHTAAPAGPAAKEPAGLHSAAPAHKETAHIPATEAAATAPMGITEAADSAGPTAAAAVSITPEVPSRQAPAGGPATAGPADQKGAAGAEPGGKENHTPGRQVDGPQAASGSKEKRSLGPWTGGSVPPSSKRQRSSEFTLRWRPLEAKGWEGQLPPERWGATFTALDDTQLCLFGGAHLGDAHLGDTWTFQVADAQWQRLAAEDYAGKAWHTAQLVDTLQGKQLVVFGGERLLPSDGATQGPTQEEEEDEVQVLHEVSILDTEAQLWVSMPVTGDGGKAPPLRTGHSTTLLPDGRVLMFGGTDGEGKHKNDLYVVDPKRLNWFGLSGIVRGAPPKPRAYHTATLVGKRVIVLGGAGSRTWSLKEVYSLHVEGWKWTEHTSEVDGEPPCARSGHSAIALPDGRHLLTYGGWAGESEVCYSDVAILDTQTWRWTTPRVEGVARPSGRAGHATALVHLEGGRSVLLLHGGRSKDDKLCRDTWVLELPASST